MYRIIERENRYYIQKRTIFGWSYLSNDDFKFKYNEIYGLYLPLIISIIFLILFVITFEVKVFTVIFGVLTFIGIEVNIFRLISNSRFYEYNLESTKSFIINQKEKKEKKEKKTKEKVYYLNIKDERIEKLRKIKN